LRWLQVLLEHSWAAALSARPQERNKKKSPLKEFSSSFFPLS
jgi:hypothetical protein